MSSAFEGNEMGQKGLLSLPPELILEIFHSLANFSSASSLARVCKVLQELVRERLASIFYAIARRSLSNFEDAERLLDAQENHSSGLHSHQMLPRNKQFLLNEQCASAACKHWNEACQVENMSHVRGDDPSLKDAERARFKRSFYQLWTICIVANESASEAMGMLNASDPIKLAGLHEIVDWAKYCSQNDFGTSRLDLEDGSWTQGFKLVSEYCSSTRPDKSRHKRVPVPGDEAPLGYWVFFDHTQIYLPQIESA